MRVSSATNQSIMMPERDINAVLRAHDQELMAIPGVVGMYVGLRRDPEDSLPEGDGGEKQQGPESSDSKDAGRLPSGGGRNWRHTGP